MDLRPKRNTSNSLIDCVSIKPLFAVDLERHVWCGRVVVFAHEENNLPRDKLVLGLQNILNMTESTASTASLYGYGDFYDKTKCYSIKLFAICTIFICLWSNV